MCDRVFDLHGRGGANTVGPCELVDGGVEGESEFVGLREIRLRVDAVLRRARAVSVVFRASEDKNKKRMRVANLPVMEDPVDAAAA